jgi:hypothetical protein
MEPQEPDQTFVGSTSILSRPGGRGVDARASHKVPWSAARISQRSEPDADREIPSNFETLSA